MISIVIPLYGEGKRWLPQLLASIEMQTYPNYEIVTSEGVEGAAANLNAAIDKVQGDFIKPMFQDDKFIEPDSLQKIAAAFYAGSWWVACNSQNGGEEGMRSDLFKPYPHITIDRLREGENTYGSPSAMAWQRNKLCMDENLKWLFDCEFYGRMAERYGVPTFVDTAVYIRQWSGMATESVASGAQRIEDHNEVVEKYRDRGGQPR